MPNNISDFLHLVTEVSSRLVSVAPGHLDAQIRCDLRQIADFFAADRCVLYRVLAQEGRVEVIYLAERDSVQSLPTSINAAYDFPWLFEQIVMQKKTLQVRSLHDLPDAAALDRENLLALQTRSALFIPLLRGGAVNHVLSIGSRRDQQPWPDVYIPQLRLLGETLLGALWRETLEREQHEALHFERLITDIASRLAGVGGWSDDADEQIRSAMHDVLTFTGNNQMGLFTIYADTGQAFHAHFASTGGVEPPQMLEYAQVCPWLYDTTVNQRTLYSYRSLNELPAAAHTDYRFLHAINHISGLFIPYVVDGVVRYLLGVASNTQAQRWPQHLVARMQALGGVFVSTLERKRIADALRRNQHGLKEAQRIASLGSWEWEVLSDRLWTSAETDHLLGTTVRCFGELLALVHPDDRDMLRRAIETSLRAPTGKNRIECRIRRPDGELRFTENHFETVGTPGSISQRVFGTLQDVTSRQQREQELQTLRTQQWHAARISQLGVLISSLSHELSQPLAAILSNAQAGLRLLADGRLDDEETAAIFTDIVNDDKRAGQVIESLRVMLRNKDPERAPIDAARTVNDVLGMLKNEFIRQQVEPESDLAADCTVQVDRAQIQQVLVNLIMNGIDAMRDPQITHRRLRIRVCRTAQDDILFSVSDTGAGLSPATLEKMFDAFWTTKTGGTGMGLAICRSIIEAHGGRITGGNNPERGATFSFTLPAFSA